MIEEKLTPAMREKLTQMIHKDYRATFYERLDCLKDSESLFEDLPYPQRYGKTLQYSLGRISVCINSDEKIVGSVKEIIPSEAQIDTVEKLTHDWWDRSLPEIQQKILWFYSYNWLRRRPPWFYSFGIVSEVSAKLVLPASVTCFMVNTTALGAKSAKTNITPDKQC